MGSPTPNTSRDKYDLTKLYAWMVLQQGVPIFDSDWNDSFQATHTYMGLLGMASMLSPEAWTGFNIYGDGVNSFTFLPPTGYIAGRPYPHRGVPSLIATVLGGPAMGLIVYGPTALTANHRNYLWEGVISDLPGGNVIEDEDKTFKTELLLAGWRIYMVDGSEAGNVIGTVSSYTGGTSMLTLSGVGTVSIGDRYRLFPPALTTPSGARTDDVYLMMVGHYVNSSEDEDVDDPTLLIESVHALECLSVVVIDEGQAGIFTSETPTTRANSADPTLVRFVKMGEIARTASATVAHSTYTETPDDKVLPHRAWEAFNVDHNDSGDHNKITMDPTDTLFVMESNNASDHTIVVQNIGGGRGSLQISEGDLLLGNTGASNIISNGSMSIDVDLGGNTTLTVRNNNSAGVYVDVNVEGNVEVQQVSGGQGAIRAASHDYLPAKSISLMYTAHDLAAHGGGGPAGLGGEDSAGNMVEIDYDHGYLLGTPSQPYVTSRTAATEVVMWIRDQIKYDQYTITDINWRIWRASTLTLASAFQLSLVEFHPTGGAQVVVGTWQLNSLPAVTTWATTAVWTGGSPTFPFAVPALTGPQYARYWRVELVGAATGDARLSWFRVDAELSSVLTV